MLGLSAQSFNIDTFNSDEFMARQLPDLKDIQWKVGDFQERRIKKGAINAGTLNSSVDREEGEAVWLINELKIMFKKKQLIEALIEKKTGKILRYIVDGEEKDPPEAEELEDCELLSEIKEKVKVPAGTFATTRSIIKCDEDTVAIWANPNVNMGGHVKIAELGKDANPKKPKHYVELVKFGTK